MSTVGDLIHSGILPFWVHPLGPCFCDIAHLLHRGSPDRGSEKLRRIDAALLSCGSCPGVRLAPHRGVAWKQERSPARDAWAPRAGLTHGDSPFYLVSAAELCVRTHTTST